jgi:ribosomal protein S18 acetylase RimI-like enzyme
MTTIRKLEPNEWKQLPTLNDEIFCENSTYDPDLKKDWAQSESGEKYFRELATDSDSCCFVAEDDGCLVGYVAASPKEFTYRNSKYLEIDNIGVIPSYREQGVAKHLIEEVTSWAKRKGYEKLYVNSYVKNTVAIEFYKHYGFDAIDVSLEKRI